MDLHKQGKSLRAVDVQKDPSINKFYSQVSSKCGSWYGFLESIGIDTSELNTLTRWNKEKVITELKAQYESGIVFRVQERDNKLRAACSRYFGSVIDAVKSAGLIYAYSGRITEERLGKEPELLGKLYKLNKQYLKTIATRAHYRSGRRIPIPDMEQEAFLIFSKLLTKIPKGVELRRYMYKGIFYGLIGLAKKMPNEVLVGDDYIMDFLDMTYNGEPI